MSAAKTKEAREERVQQAVTVILQALEATGFAEDPSGALEALVVAGGYYALASEQPRRAMEMLRQAAEGSLLLTDQSVSAEAIGP